MNFLTIDPGCRKDGGLAIAIFENKQINPILTMAFVSAQSSFKQRQTEICRVFSYWLIENKSIYLLDKVYIEKPQFFESAKGLTAARSNSLFKLIFTYGRLFQIIESQFGVKNTHNLEINKWKGQLSKSQVEKRVKSACKKEYKGDICDAVGMGLFLKELL